MSAECYIHGCDLVYPEGSWPVGECPECRAQKELDEANARIAVLEAASPKEPTPGEEQRLIEVIIGPCTRAEGEAAMEKVQEAVDRDLAHLGPAVALQFSISPGKERTAAEIRLDDAAASPVPDLSDEPITLTNAAQMVEDARQEGFVAGKRDRGSQDKARAQIAESRLSALSAENEKLKRELSEAREATTDLVEQMRRDHGIVARPTSQAARSALASHTPEEDSE